MKSLLYAGMASRVLAQDLGIEGKSFLGLGQTIPPVFGGETDTKGNVSPAAAFLIAQLALWTTQDPEEHKRRQEELIETGKALIPLYLGGTKIYQGFLKGGWGEALKGDLSKIGGESISQTGEVRFKGKLSYRVGPGAERIAASLGLPTVTQAAKNRVLDRQRRFSEAKRSHVAEIKEKMFAAFEDQDFPKMQQIWEELKEEGYAGEMPDNMLDTMTEYLSVDAVMRSFKRDKKAAVQSGALEEARRSGLMRQSQQSKGRR
jgi:hypothetical protein